MPSEIKPEEQAEPKFFQLIVFPFGELLLTILPLLVIAIVEILSEKGWWQILQSPEWSFGSAVLFGQTIFKFVAGIVRGHADQWEMIALIVVLLIVIGLVPSLVILALRLTVSQPSNLLINLQTALFCLSAVSFVVLGAVSHYGLFHASKE